MTTEFDRLLQGKISKLKKDHLLQRDLWTGIEMALLNGNRRRVPWLAVAASLLVVVSAVGVWFRAHHVGTSAPSYANYAERLDEQHRNTIAALKAAYRNTPALTTDWNDQLNVMERAADSVRKALRDDPDNIALLRMLNEVYQQEIDLLRKVHQPLQPDQTV